MKNWGCDVVLCTFNPTR